MNQTPETPKRPRGSRGGRRVQELREKGELPAAGSKAAVRLNAKRDKARRFAEKKAAKKARRAERLELRKTNTGSIRSEDGIAAVAAIAQKLPKSEAVAKAFSVPDKTLSGNDTPRTAEPDDSSLPEMSEGSSTTTSRKRRADPESIVKKSSSKRDKKKKESASL